MHGILNSKLVLPSEEAPMPLELTAGEAIEILQRMVGTQQ